MAIHVTRLYQSWTRADHKGLCRNKERHPNKLLFPSRTPSLCMSRNGQRCEVVNISLFNDGPVKVYIAVLSFLHVKHPPAQSLSSQKSA